MTFTQVQAQTTKTAAFSGSGVDISGITGDWTLKINVSSMSDSSTNTPQVRLVFEDSVNQYTAYLGGPAVSFKGALFPASDKVHSFKKQDFPDLRLGVTSALLRLTLSNIEATGSVTYRAWIES